MKPEMRKTLAQLLKQKGAFDVISAMRGPDYAAGPSGTPHNVKQITTAVVRKLAGVGGGVGVDVRTHDSAESFWMDLRKADRNRVRKWLKENYHFRSHIYEALDELGVEGRSHRTWIGDVLQEKD